MFPEKQVQVVVKKNNKVRVHYVGTLGNGTIFDKSSDKEPLEFVVGNGQIIPGFEQAVLGMGLNEEKKVTVKAESAYGLRDEKLIGDFPRSSLPEGFTPQNGMVITLHDQAGREIPATIVGVAEQNIIIDLNYPLAGKDLNFSIKVIGIE